MGIITAIGISVANGILLVTVAESRRRAIYAESAGSESERRQRAALAAAEKGVGLRLRPILMTASAMIAGMVPMALAWESGGGQSAPLGQAVIGGLAASTASTLLIMPAVYAALLRRQGVHSPSLDEGDAAMEESLAEV